MRVFKLFISLCLVVSQLNIASPSASAVSNSVVISQIQTGGSGSGAAGQEFIELYNNTDNDINVTDWCVTYSSANDNSASIVGCFAAPDTSTTLWVKPGGYTTLTSPDFEIVSSENGDITFSYAGGISGIAGHVRLFDVAKNEIDKVAWGVTTLDPETAASSAPAGGKALQRKTANPTGLQDTDNNSDDFTVIAPQLHTTGLFEVISIIDLCPNIDGSQVDIPTGHIQNSQGNCVLNLLPLQVTELLPNAIGTDTGQEYIELHNPTDRTADLSLYKLYTGLNNEKSYQFPAGSFIAPGGYAVFRDSDLHFTLVNTSGRVALMGADGSAVTQTDAYANPSDGQSWALINGMWQYTNRPTPGGSNILSVQEEESDNESSVLASCPAGKYRHPLTNRCRNIETDAALATCEPDQYRNPDTGRCRKVVTTAVAPCKDGQYRSEETNRCRNISTASADLTPCKEGQERSPDTNRCRKIQAASVPAADYAVQSVKDGAKSFVGWWALGGVALLAVGYAGWEWRREVRTFIAKAAAIFTRH